MPSRRYGRYRFFFYVADLVREPIHFHIEDGGQIAKFWLKPIECASTGGLRAHELRKIEQVIEANYVALVAFWEEERSKLHL